MEQYALYWSKAIYPEFGRHDLDILRASLRHNSRVGLTGFLYREKDYYFQYLEGGAAALEELLARLAKDPRHYDFEIISRGSHPARQFGYWSMGYANGGSLPFDPRTEDSRSILRRITEIISHLREISEAQAKKIPGIAGGDPQR